MRNTLLACVLALVGCARPTLPVSVTSQGVTCTVAMEDGPVTYTGEACSTALALIQVEIEAVVGPVNDCLDGAFVFVPSGPESFEAVCHLPMAEYTACTLDVPPFSFAGSYLVVVAPDVWVNDGARTAALDHEARHRASYCLSGRNGDPNHEGLLFE